MVRGIANSKIGFGDLILLLRYFFKLKVSTHTSNRLLKKDLNEYNISLGKIRYNYETKPDDYRDFFTNLYLFLLKISRKNNSLILISSNFIK